MKIEELTLGKYNPNKVREQLIKAVQEDRWLAIVSPPHDFSEINPRKVEVLRTVSNILGRLAVAGHAAYQGIYQDELAPLLKRDKKNGKFQYLVATTDPNYYYVVSLKGEVIRMFSKGKELLCQGASFVLVPEVEIPTFKEYFVAQAQNPYKWDDYAYCPRLEKGGYSVYPIYDAKSATSLVFNEKGHIWDVYTFKQENKGLFTKTYRFDLEKGSIGAVSFRDGGDMGTVSWNFFSKNSTFSLCQDGVLRSNKGEEESPMGEALMGIVANLPLVNYINDTEAIS